MATDIEEPVGDQYKLWRDRLRREKKAHNSFRDEAIEAEKAARNDNDEGSSFNIQWSNCKIKANSIYSSRPIPDVRKRYTNRNQQQTPDPNDKELARLMERAIEYQIDTGDFDSPAKAVVKDFVQTGLGLPRVVYDVQTRPIDNPMLQAMAEEAGEGPPEEIVSQSVGIEHIPWRFVHWEPGRTGWNSVGWVAIESYHPRTEISDKYGIKIKSGKDDLNYKTKGEDYVDQVQVYEIFDKKKREIIVLTPAHPQILETSHDKLKLTGFYPFPRPLFANLKSDEIIPRPDYFFIKPQIKKLSDITGRIDAITALIKPNAFSDSSLKGLADLMGADDGTIKLVPGLKELLDGSNLRDALQYLPIDVFANVVAVLQIQADQKKEEIFEIYGVSDIQRGATKASETAAAQTIKGYWGNVRLSEDAGEVARIWREVFRMFTEIMSEHFDPVQLQLMTGIEVTQQMQEIMRSDVSRSFAIDIESDSTIAKDDQEDRRQTMDLVQTINGYLEQTVPAVQNGLLPPDFVVETLLFMVSKHKNGKQLEDAISELGPHFQGLLQFQQQIQGMQQQMEQMNQALQQKDQQLQRAGQQIQGMGKELARFNERKELREDAKVRSEIKDKQDDNIIDSYETSAEVKLKAAQAAKTWSEVQPNIRRM